MQHTVPSIKTILEGHQPKKLTILQTHSAAVLMPIVQQNNSLHLLFTKRTDVVEHHKGQISFPGGMMDDGDESVVHTALRETEEEIGLPSSAVSIIGQLDDIHVPSGFIVTPIVGYIESLPALSTSQDEVAEILFIPIEKFFDPALRRSETRTLKNVTRQVYFYDVWKEPVWGATAFIIKQFTDLMESQ
ncbi:MAG: CoA pyrophosphatase [Bacteroidota bacterium]|nr:CoA pyrophosphatase [Bacteroidota bacterium]